LIGIPRGQGGVVEGEQHRIDVEHPLEAGRIEVAGHGDSIGHRRFDAEPVENGAEVSRPRMLSLQLLLAGDAEQRLYRRRPVGILGAKPHRQRTGRHRRRVDFGVVGESRVRMVIEDPDLLDLREQTLIGGGRSRRHQRARLR
jgi:hypothetical protein